MCALKPLRMCPHAAAYVSSCVLMLLHMCPHATVYCYICLCSGVKAEGGNDGDAQGLEKHNQFLWAKKMGQQNEPRWGLFKQVEYYYMCPHTSICVRILLYMCPHTIIEQNEGQ